MHCITIARKLRTGESPFFIGNNTINVKSGRMTDMTYGIGGCASIASAVCCAHVGNVDMADDIVVNGHILSYDVPAMQKQHKCILFEKLSKKSHFERAKRATFFVLLN